MVKILLKFWVRVSRNSKEILAKTSRNYENENVHSHPTRETIPLNQILLFFLQTFCNFALKILKGQ